MVSTPKVSSICLTEGGTPLSSSALVITIEDTINHLSFNVTVKERDKFKLPVAADVSVDDAEGNHLDDFDITILSCDGNYMEEITEHIQAYLRTNKYNHKESVV